MIIRCKFCGDTNEVDLEPGETAIPVGCCEAADCRVQNLKDILGGDDLMVEEWPTPESSAWPPSIIFPASIDHPADHPEDEIKAYDLKTPEGVTAYTQAKISQVMEGFDGQEYPIHSPVHKMAVNAIRVALQGVAEKLGYNRAIVESNPQTGELLIGLAEHEDEDAEG